VRRPGGEAKNSEVRPRVDVPRGLVELHSGDRLVAEDVVGHVEEQHVGRALADEVDDRRQQRAQLADVAILDDGNRMWIVDWEYSGMNDPIWDLGDVSVEAEFDQAQPARGAVRPRLYSWALSKDVSARLEITGDPLTKEQAERLRQYVDLTVSALAAEGE